MAIQLSCDNCTDEVSDDEAITVTVQRPGQEPVVNHADAECFDLAVSGDTEAIQALLLG